jgi:hypothetical protein
MTLIERVNIGWRASANLLLTLRCPVYRAEYKTSRWNHVKPPVSLGVIVRTVTAVFLRAVGVAHACLEEIWMVLQLFPAMGVLAVDVLWTSGVVVAHFLFRVPHRARLGMVVVLGGVSSEVLPVVGVDALGAIFALGVRAETRFVVEDVEVDVAPVVVQHFGLDLVFRVRIGAVPAVRAARQLVRVVDAELVAVLLRMVGLLHLCVRQGAIVLLLAVALVFHALAEVGVVGVLRGVSSPVLVLVVVATALEVVMIFDVAGMHLEKV